MLCPKCSDRLQRMLLPTPHFVFVALHCLLLSTPCSVLIEPNLYVLICVFRDMYVYTVTDVEQKFKCTKTKICNGSSLSDLGDIPVNIDAKKANQFSYGIQ